MSELTSQQEENLVSLLKQGFWTNPTRRLRM